MTIKEIPTILLKEGQFLLEDGILSSNVRIEKDCSQRGSDWLRGLTRKYIAFVRAIYKKKSLPSKEL